MMFLLILPKKKKIRESFEKIGEGIKGLFDTTIQDSVQRYNSKFYTKKDIVIIPVETGDTLRYTKSDFNQIIDNHPEFFAKYIRNPDDTYSNRVDRNSFKSEVGQDEYYVLYAYFLKQRNGIGKYAEMRRKLIDIFHNINSLFQAFEHGGTYFGHQYYRVLGYAEYSVYMYNEYRNNLSKTYDITKQKRILYKISTTAY